jgi:hypothetical protein
MAIFNSYVKLPEGIFGDDPNFLWVSRCFLMVHVFMVYVAVQRLVQ